MATFSPQQGIAPATPCQTTPGIAQTTRGEMCITAPNPIHEELLRLFSQEEGWPVARRLEFVAKGVSPPPATRTYASLLDARFLAIAESRVSYIMHWCWCVGTTTSLLCPEDTNARQSLKTQSTRWAWEGRRMAGVYDDRKRLTGGGGCKTRAFVRFHAECAKELVLPSVHCSWGMSLKT